MILKYINIFEENEIIIFELLSFFLRSFSSGRYVCLDVCYVQCLIRQSTGVYWAVELDSWAGQLDWTIGVGFQWDSFLLNRRSLTDSKVYEMFLRKTK